jgi:hypothetical protein
MENKTAKCARLVLAAKLSATKVSTRLKQSIAGFAINCTLRGGLAVACEASDKWVLSTDHAERDPAIEILVKDEPSH